ncbi:Elongation factor 1-beta [Dissostichus eleginoides]|uniref:Elongation factor 1-beta n=1 Tax=Dissostichus eleginoides TaxID=100907 RepID=A0AAD9B615_DISEL|nr:Elongation factor 1-beta [Dissostichus eleginoides]
MGFGDLRSARLRLKVLNGFLSERSYIEGYVPSQADVAVFDSLSGAPSADLVHVLRCLPGVKKPLGGGRRRRHRPVRSDEEEDEEAERLKEERLAQYAAKKSKKPTIIAKSSLLLDVKPWDDETDMKQLEALVRSISMEGLLWGQSKLLPVGYGIQKLQINCVIEDDKVGTDMLEEQITAFEDFVQSMDVAAFNKI